ncbi:hypothetical protein [Catenulispora rubra]|uniref:hypothetical protein n=1 Tax=Catenulispora rubra TaxID=280293 RepID=UPI00189208E1|nr:hypothetical protein [Catenulispora rubra]
MTFAPMPSHVSPLVVAVVDPRLLAGCGELLAVAGFLIVRRDDLRAGPGNPRGCRIRPALGICPAGIPARHGSPRQPLLGVLRTPPGQGPLIIDPVLLHPYSAQHLHGWEVTKLRWGIVAVNRIQDRHTVSADLQHERGQLGFVLR